MVNRKNRTAAYEVRRSKSKVLPPGLIAVKRQTPSKELVIQQNKALESVLSPREKEVFYLILEKVAEGNE